MLLSSKYAQPICITLIAQVPSLLGQSELINRTRTDAISLNKYVLEATVALDSRPRHCPAG